MADRDEQTTPSDDRLRRVEEQQAFADRASEELSGEVYELMRRLERLGKRMDGLESRIDSLIEALEEPRSGGGDPAVDERPPHSAGRPGLDR
ncbi:MAG: SlyX family protein [Planctomycetota bacterium]